MLHFAKQARGASVVSISTALPAQGQTVHAFQEDSLVPVVVWVVLFKRTTILDQSLKASVTSPCLFIGCSSGAPVAANSAIVW